MRDDVKQALLRVVEEWCEPLRQAEGRIARAEGSAATEEGAVDLLMDAMVQANAEAFGKLKLARTLLLDSSAD